MEDKPYKFNGPNPRIASNVEQHAGLWYLTGAIFVGSLYLYNRRTFRMDQNVVNFIGFTGASAFASYTWASTFLSSPINEAGLINNAKELQHWETEKHSQKSKVNDAGAVHATHFQSLFSCTLQHGSCVQMWEYFFQSIFA